MSRHHRQNENNHYYEPIQSLDTIVQFNDKIITSHERPMLKMLPHNVEHELSVMIDVAIQRIDIN